MVGKIFITRSGYDPQLGKHAKDPYLGPNPTLGACRPDVRKQLTRGDHITKPKKVGRPKLPKGEAKGRIVPVRFSAEDLKQISAAAKASGQTLSDWIRSALNSALKAL